MAVSRLTEFRSQIMAGESGENIIGPGGKVMVCLAGQAKKATISDQDGNPLTNPFTPARGFIYFTTAEAITAVDLYIQDQFGDFSVARGILASGPNEFRVPAVDRQQTMVIPFHYLDNVPGTEKDSGFVLPANTLALAPGAMIQTTLAGAGSTITAGTLSTEGGTANLLSGTAKSTAAVGVQPGGLAAAADVSSRKISYTQSAGSLAAGFIYIPILVAQPN